MKKCIKLIDRGYRPVGYNACWERTKPTAHRQLFDAFKYVNSIAIIPKGYGERLKRSCVKRNRTPPMQTMRELHDERNQWIWNLALVSTQR